MCIEEQSSDQIRALLCGHFFCKTCWSQHLNALINEGIATGEWGGRMRISGFDYTAMAVAKGVDKDVLYYKAC